MFLLGRAWSLLGLETGRAWSLLGLCSAVSIIIASSSACASLRSLSIPHGRVVARIMPNEFRDRGQAVCDYKYKLKVAVRRNPPCSFRSRKGFF